MIFSLFWEGEFIRRGAFIRGGAFILKSEILGGIYLRGEFIRGGAFIQGNTVSPIMYYQVEVMWYLVSLYSIIILFINQFTTAK